MLSASLFRMIASEWNNNSLFGEMSHLDEAANAPNKRFWQEEK